MSQFLAEKLNSQKLKDVMDLFMIYIKLDLDMQDLVQELGSQFGIFFDGLEDVKEFSHYIQT